MRNSRVKVFLALSLLSSTVQGTWLKGKDLSGSGGRGDEFGRDVDITSDSLAGIALNDPDDPSGDKKPHVVFYRKTGPSTFRKVNDAYPEAGAVAEGDYLHSVAIHGEYAVAGRPDADGEGAAYIFYRDPVQRTWSIQAKITPTSEATQAGSHFGFSVDIKDGKVAVGAPDFGSTITAPGGAVFIFKRVGNIWNEEDKLVAAAGIANDRFGYSVSFDETGTSIAIGAPDVLADAGAVYVFTDPDENGIWDESETLVSVDTEAGERFGESVGMTSSRIVVGAGGDSENGDSSGSAYVFFLDEGDFVFEQKLLPNDGGAGDVFGNSVDIDAGTGVDKIVVGAYSDSGAADNSGSAYVFELNGGGKWSQNRIARKGNDVRSGEAFGTAVAISDGVVAVGGPMVDGRGNAEDEGKVFVYRDRCRWWQFVCWIFHHGSTA
jgi:hypothetical protein